MITRWQRAELIFDNIAIIYHKSNDNEYLHIDKLDSIDCATADFIKVVKDINLLYDGA